MTVSMRRMSAGSGYQYLLRSVAVGDADRVLSTPLTRYYSEVGTPPGRWLGSGLAALGGGRIEPGMRVTEEQLALLIGMGRDPIIGDQLGRAYPAYKPVTERIRARVDALDPDLNDADCGAETARIEADELAAGVRQPVAGFDLTFSVPKSVSVLWGIADAQIQERIVAAHHHAVGDVVAYFEREVAATRAGISDSDGAVVQVAVSGVAAVAFDHFDSRAGDPQLHTHVVLANKVLTVMDRRWRSLDGRPVFASRTGLSALYDAVLADRLNRDLGIEWELRQRGADRNPRWEIAGVPDSLIGEFSSRTRDIEIKKDELIAEYVAQHGRRPSARVIVQLRAESTLATRPAKEVRSLTDLTADWRDRAAERLGADPTAWALRLLGSTGEPLSIDDVPIRAVEAIAADVVAAVSVRQAVWNHWNLMAEAAKQTMDLRFASTGDREHVVGLIVEAAQLKSVMLTPPELALTPRGLQREDGSSMFRPRYSEKYSSTAVLDAEARLLVRADNATGPTVRSAVVERHLARGRVELSAEQCGAVAAICASGRVADVLVGPAGAGKTTTMNALRSAWIAEHGRGSVVGLAPSAAAAQALAGDLNVACENTAKWLYEYDRGRTELRRGQLVIIDEATLADTTTLDRITSIAAAAGAKALLVGDPHQLQSVDAGGAFALLVDRLPHAPHLTELHRFTHEWEKNASLALSRGEPEVIATYARHHRIREGVTDVMVDAAYDAWRTDCDTGLASILVTESSRDVRALNERARAERILRDRGFEVQEVELQDGCRASVGDLVITRLNDRRIRIMSGGWVRNGDRWRITDIRRDGSIAVSRLSPGGGRRTVLPATYVGENLDLGYAVTAHRAQGITVDTAHVVVTPSTTRENLYVSMTRGRESNIAYVALDQPDVSHSTPEPDDVSARTVLYGVLQHSGAELSAHQTIEAEYELHGGIDRLAAELETIGAGAQHNRFVDVLSRSGLTAEQHAAVVNSPAFGPLTAALRRAEAYRHDLERLVPRIVGRHGLDDADDVAAVLLYRVEKVASSAPHGYRLRPRLIAGLIPEPLGGMSAEDRQAIDERKELIESRARALAENDIDSHETWTRRLGPRPSDAGSAEAWFDAATTVAAYRDRYKITSDLPVGGGVRNDAQRAERRRALGALRSMRSADAVERSAMSSSVGVRAISAP